MGTVIIDPFLKGQKETPGSCPEGRKRRTELSTNLFRIRNGLDRGLGASPQKKVVFRFWLLVIVNSVLSVMSVCLSVFPSAFLPFCPSVLLSFFLSFFLSFCAFFLSFVLSSFSPSFLTCSCLFHYLFLSCASMIVGGRVGFWIPCHSIKLGSRRCPRNWQATCF